MPDLAARLEAVQRRIRQACAASGRPPGSTSLIAVSKTVAVDVLMQARNLGVGDFGESYLQEALPKLQAMGRDATQWHFIGPLQSNKTRDISAHFDWVHGVDRLKIAQRLSEQRPANLPPLCVCVQVNISDEHSKSGCAPQDTLALCLAVSVLPRLRLRGLMAIPAPAAVSDGGAAYASLQRLHWLVKSSLPDGADAFDTISAGMSDDLEAAIAHGSTLVRVGSALFGERPPSEREHS